MTRILVIDNYDSFVYTLNGYLREIGAETEVIRNDTWSVEHLTDRISDYDGLLISPGPGTPADAGVSIAAVHLALNTSTPLLGVCLGHQAIAEALGGIVAVAPELMHGKTSLIEHTDSTIFHGVSNPFTGTRYHSLAIVDGTVPAELTVTARTVDSGVIMGVQHVQAPVYGVQFHPESVLTQGGYQMIGNWLEAAGLAGAAERAATLTPLVATHS